MPQEKKRIGKWDNLKFILVFLVVVGHMSDFYSDKFTAARGIFMFIYSFHMPLFLFVSGMFSKKNIEEKRYSNIFSYLILYFFIKFIIYLTSNRINRGVGLSILSENSAPWYAFALFVMSLVTIALKNTSPVYVLVCSVVFSCLLGYDPTVSTYLMMSRVAVFFPFFYLGYALDNEKIYAFLQQKKIKIISAVILALFIALIVWKNDAIYWTRPLLTGQNPFRALKVHPKFGGLYRLAYYAVAVLIGGSVASLIPERLFGSLGALYGSRSVQVYSLHYCFLNIFLVFFAGKTADFTEGQTVILIFALSVFITVLCSQKFFASIFKFILSPEKRRKKQ